MGRVREEQARFGYLSLLLACKRRMRGCLASSPWPWSSCSIWILDFAGEFRDIVCRDSECQYLELRSNTRWAMLRGKVWDILQAERLGIPSVSLWWGLLNNALEDVLVVWFSGLCVFSLDIWGGWGYKRLTIYFYRVLGSHVCTVAHGWKDTIKKEFPSVH